MRQVSGLTLKAEIEKNFAYLSMPVIDYIKERLLVAFYDPEHAVRKTVGSIMSTLIVKGGFYIWPGLIEFLTNNLAHQDATVVENSIQALCIIVEDAQGLFEDEKFHKMIAGMLPSIFRLLDTSQTEAIKQHAINTINKLLVTRAPDIMAAQEQYMRHILSMSVDPSSLVRFRIVQGIAAIADMDVDVILKPENFAPIAQLMLLSLKNKDDTQARVAQAACEFWSAMICAYAEDEETKIKLLREQLASLLPLLMECCLMTEEDVMTIIQSKEEDAYADRKPKGILKEGETEEEDEENYEVDLSENCLTLRKTAAFTISRFAQKYNDDVFRVLQPYLENGMASGNNELIEPSVLVLGIISDEGCALGAVTPFLGNIVPFLMQFVESKYPYLRSTNLWTLSQFIDFISEDEQMSEAYFRLACQRMTDDDSGVQESACTALIKIVESYPELTYTYINYLIEAITIVIDTYKGASLISLLDLVGFIAQSLGPQFREQNISGKILPLLNKKWVSIADDSKTLFPLFECFESVVTALGPEVQSFAMPIFQRSCMILQNFLSKAQVDIDNLYGDSSFLIRSIDLLTAIFNSIGPLSGQLIVQSNLIQILIALL